jgi:MSHA biogenesis protein MshJ
MEKSELARRWEAVSVWIDARSLSERLALLGALAAATVFIGYDIGIAPRLRDIERNGRQIATNAASLSKLEGEIAKLSSQHVIDPNEENRARIRALREEIARINATVEGYGRNFVKPDDMASMLEDLLARQGKLTLVSLSKLPLQDMMSAGLRAGEAAPGASEKDAGAKAETVYKHGIRVVVRGGYADLVAYLQQLEALPARLGWGEIRLDASDSGQSKLSFDVYTFGMEKTWLHI